MVDDEPIGRTVDDDLDTMCELEEENEAFDRS